MDKKIKIVGYFLVKYPLLLQLGQTDQLKTLITEYFIGVVFYNLEQIVCR